MKLENKRGCLTLRKIRIGKNPYNEENPGLYCMEEKGVNINIEGIKVNKGGI